MPDEISLPDVVWTLGSVCSLHRRAFDAELLVRELPSPPLTTDSLITASRLLGFKVKRRSSTRAELSSWPMPCVVLLSKDSAAARSGLGEPSDGSARPGVQPALLVQMSESQVMLFRAGTNQPTTLGHQEFEAEFTGVVFQFAPINDPLKDPDGARVTQRAFGFRWFIPELLKHKRVWRDVLIASLSIQLLP